MLKLHYQNRGGEIMEKPNISIYAQGQFEKYWDLAEMEAEKKDRSLSYIVGSILEKHYKGDKK